MREAAIPGYRLSNAKRSTRVLVTLGLLGLLLGLLGAVALTVLKTGITPTSVQTYYLGSNNNGNSSDSLNSLLTTKPRPIAELAEVTHLHLMGGSLLLFLLCHLLALCKMSEGIRTSLYCISFISFISTFGSPWLIVFVSPAAAYLYGPSILVFYRDYGSG